MKRLSLAFLAALGMLSSAAPALAITHYQQVEVCSAQTTAGCAKFDAGGNLLVSASGGGSVTVTFPYSSATGQTPTAASFVGIAGFDGTNVAGIKVSTSGILNTTICTSAGAFCAATNATSGASLSTATNVLDTASFAYVYNGTNWNKSLDATAGNNFGPGGLPVDVGYGQYNSSLPTITTGNYTALQTDVNGRLLDVPYLPYGVSASQTPLAHSIVGVAGEDTAGNVEPLLMAVSGSPINQVCGVANTGTTTGPTGTNQCAQVVPAADNLGSAVTINGLLVTNIPEVYSSTGNAYDRVYAADLGNNAAASLKATMPISAPYGEYNSSLPTLTNGHSVMLQTDVNGRLLTSGTGNVTFPYSSAATQTATASSFVGTAGFDGTNVEPIMTSTSGAVSSQICDPRGQVGGFCADVLAPADTLATTRALSTNSLNAVWSGAVWQRAKSASGISASVAGTGLPVDVAMGQYSSSPPTVTSGQYGALQTDVNGRLLTSGTGTVTFPYTSALTQTATASSFVGIAGYDGTNVDGVHTSTTGNIYVAPDPSPTSAATLSTVVAANASTLILAAGTAKDRWSVCNESSSIMYLAEAASASATAYSWAFPAMGTVATCMTDEGIGLYTGPLYGFWATATGNARISVR